MTKTPLDQNANPYAPPKPPETNLSREPRTKSDVSSAIIFYGLLMLAMIFGFFTAMDLHEGRTADAGGQFFLTILFVTAALGYKTAG